MECAGEVGLSQLSTSKFINFYLFLLLQDEYLHCACTPFMNKRC